MYHAPNSHDVYDPKDSDLRHLRTRLYLISQQQNTDINEIAEWFVAVNGDVDRIEDYIKDRSIGWSEIEDLALAKPEDSPEFKILLAEKGWASITARRKFLQATPKLSEITDTN